MNILAGFKQFALLGVLLLPTALFAGDPPSSDAAMAKPEITLPGRTQPALSNPGFTLLDADSEADVSGYVARIELNDPAEVGAALARAEQLYLDGGLETGVPPIAFVLHGPEVKIFLKENYQQYKSIVDLAARLSAFNVVDIKVCDTRRRAMGILENPLYPFVGTVRLGVAEVDRLVTQEKYEFF